MSTSEHRPLRIGLIGTGFGTRVHCPAIVRRSDVEVAMICSARFTRAEAAAKRFDIEHFTDDWRDVLARDDIDLIDICTPPDSHAEISLAAFAAGKHVFCEKPLAVNSQETQSMAAAAAGASAEGLVHAVNHEMRYLPIRRQIFDLVRAGFIGEPQLVSLNIHVGYGTDPTMEPYYWGWLSESARGGGALMSMFSHQIDLIRYTFGEIHEPVGRVTTLITERPVLGFEYRDGDPIGPDTPTFGTKPVETDDTAVFTARLGNRGLLSMSASWSVRHGSGITLEAYGDRGTLRLLPDGRLFGGAIGDTQLEQFPPLPALDSLPGDHHLTAATSELFGEIAASIRHGTPSTFATFDDGHRLQQIIDAVRSGAKENS